MKKTLAAVAKDNFKSDALKDSPIKRDLSGLIGQKFEKVIEDIDVGCKILDLRMRDADTIIFKVKYIIEKGGEPGMVCHQAMPLEQCHNKLSDIEAVYNTEGRYAIVING